MHVVVERRGEGQLHQQQLQDRVDQVLLEQLLCVLQPLCLLDFPPAIVDTMVEPLHGLAAF